MNITEKLYAIIPLLSIEEQIELRKEFDKILYGSSDGGECPDEGGAHDGNE